MIRPNHRALLAALAFVLSLVLGPGCMLMAGAGVGYIITRDVLPDNVHTAQVQLDVEEVWTSARESFSFLLDPGAELSVENYPRVAKGKVDGADVTVTVEAYDLEHTILRVAAEKYLTSDGQTAESVLTYILDRLKK